MANNVSDRANTQGPKKQSSDEQHLVIDLKNAETAAFLAWLVPGLGHIYQGRMGKGILFAVCILGTFFSGMYLGQGRVVYAAWNDYDNRVPYYVGQFFVGLPALPALVQKPGGNSMLGKYMAPPASQEELDLWIQDNGDGFEIGSIYTLIAGLLNILAIYDAWAGPVVTVPDAKKPKKGKDPPEEDDSQEKAS